MIGHLTLGLMIASASLVVAILAVCTGFAFVPAFLGSFLAFTGATVFSLAVGGLDQ